MKFGFTLPNNFGVTNPKDVVELGVQAEELGFDPEAIADLFASGVIN